jgi:hypothetical protein
MLSSGMWRRVDLVRTDVSEEHRFHLQGRKNTRARKVLDVCEQTELQYFILQDKNAFSFDFTVYVLVVLATLLSAC